MSESRALIPGRWLLIVLPAALIAAYAIAVLSSRALGPPFIYERLAQMPLVVIGHLGGSAIALVTGALQVNARLRNRYLNLHRWLGRTYVIAVAIGGTSGFILATRSQGGLVTHIGFGAMAASWLFTTALAWRYIRRGDQVEHRRWMLRSYAVAFGAVTLRIYLAACLAAGLPFVDVYQPISWASWVPNLLFVDWWLLRPRKNPAARQAATTSTSGTMETI